MRAAICCLAMCLAVAGCDAGFEDASIVIDLRMLGAVAEPAEVLVPLDAAPGTFVPPDVRICALVADPGPPRGLDYEMRACAPTDTRRCDEPDEPVQAFASGTVADPETTAAAVELCGTLSSSPALFDILSQSIEDDPLQGFSSVAVQIEIFVKPTGASDGDGIFGAKRSFFAAQIPDERRANTNPRLDSMAYVIGESEPVEPYDAIGLARCADPGSVPILVAPGQALTLLPIEPDDVREDYVLPTLDGGSRMFTENLSYAWFATSGEWTDETSGGPGDVVFGNEAQLDTTWVSPVAVDQLTDVELWVVQRDERGGQAWYAMCVQVDPGG